MYSIEWSRVFPRQLRERSAPCGASSECVVAESGTVVRAKIGRKVHRTVWALGFTSLFTDISSEMIASVLPVYLVLHLGMSPLMFGVVDGIYQGAAAIVRLVSGVLADRWSRHKEIAAFGYSLSATCRLAILAVGNAWGAIAGVVALDRIGKGIRTAPRDALISHSSSSAELSTAFGVHRALDAAGATVGPVIAFALLALIPQKFDVLFVVSFGFAIIGLGTIFLFVPVERSRDHYTGAPTASIKAAFSLLVERRFRAQVLASIILGLSTISDSFVFLILQNRSGLSVSAFPLLYVGTTFCTAALASPIGRLADRAGRTAVLLGGYALLVTVYILLLLPSISSGFPVIAAVLLFGAYYAATDGVLTAMAASVLPADRRGSGLAVLATATNLARLSGSVLFGFLWYSLGAGRATIAFLLALLISILAASRMLNPPKRYVDDSASV